MDTIHIDKKNTLMIAHRGASYLEKENTLPAFVAAGNRSYYGVECDVHKTIDGKYVIIHDDNTMRVAGIDMEVEKSSFEDLRSLVLTDVDGKTLRNDIKIPSLEEYILICKKYNKICVLEFKNAFKREEIFEMVSIIDNLEYLENVIFISFVMENLLYLKEIYPKSKAQFLTEKAITDNLIVELRKHSLDIDCEYNLLNKEIIDKLHANNIKINCWTCNDKDVANKLIDLGVDYITSNNLE